MGTFKMTSKFPPMLMNNQNSCYVNSLFQCFWSMQEYQSIIFNTSGEENQLKRAFRDLYTSILNNNDYESVFDTQNIQSNLRLQDTNMQNDVHEAYLDILRQVPGLEQIFSFQSESVRACCLRNKQVLFNNHIPANFWPSHTNLVNI